MTTPIAPESPPGGESRRARALRLRVEARRLAIEHSWTIDQIHKAFADRGDTLNIGTVREWSAKEQWSRRREEHSRIALRKDVERVRRDMRLKLPKAVETMEGTADALLKRSAGVLLNAGQFCKSCGRGKDSDKGIFKPNARDVIALAEFRLKLLGFEDGGPGGTAPIDEFPMLPPGALRELGDFFARWEGLPVVVVDEHTGMVRPGELGEGVDDPDDDGDG